MAYFTIVTLQDGKWHPQFGDKERAVVVDEMQEYRGFKARIVKTRSARQTVIDAEIDALNRHEARRPGATTDYPIPPRPRLQP